ncbi:MAG TPA: CocE/NonD family hydrolase, partial [Chitinophagales bacterium]|nr:CocE/NonD family hydrolase [Chitinophagales bacterium]
MKKVFLSILLLGLIVNGIAQTPLFPIPGAQVIPGEKINGTLDDISDFATRTQIPVPMPDGTKLMTDIFLPILQDSFTYVDTFDITILPAPFPPLRIPINAVLLHKGFQYLIYDSINGAPNPNPYQLPLIMERTPYNKRGSVECSAMALLGYAGANQDMRGRYSSQGAYLPLYSDSWKKWPYHNYTHVLDITNPSDPRNGNNHEDGYNTVEFIKNNLVRAFDFNHDGIADDTALVYNGSIGTFGASALGYNQLQAAAAHKIDPTQPGLKALFPIVGPLEFYKSTGFHNGCLRDMLVTGWLRGQIVDTRDDLMAFDTGLNDDIHSSKDYNTVDKFEAANKAIDHFVTVRYENYPCGYYPNSISRSDMDATHAPVNAAGESEKNGMYSRYGNIEVPVFHVSGWWDIFVDGSIETHDLIRRN